jgi:integrase
MIYFKIDYFDRAMSMHSPDPADPSVSQRVITSNKRRPMSSMYGAVRRRTKKAFGFGLNLHAFRHAAASFWSIRDPANVRGVKDLLGQATFGITEKHYIMGQSRLAGRALAQAVDAARK